MKLFSNFTSLFKNIIPFLYSLFQIIIKKKYELLLKDLKSFKFNISGIVYIYLNHFIINLFIFILFLIILSSFLSCLFIFFNIIPSLLNTIIFWIFNLPYIDLILGYTGIWFIFLAHCIIIYSIICLIWKKGYSKTLWIKNIQFILKVLLLFFAYLFLLGLFLLISVNIIDIFFNFDYIEYFTNLLNDLFNYLINLFYIYDHSFLNNSIDPNSFYNTVRINDIFLIFSPTDNNSIMNSSLLSAKTINTEVKPEQVGLISAFKDEHNYNFSINKDLTHNIANKIIDVIKNALFNAGNIITTGIGASAGAKAGLELVKNSPMPLPAKVVTVAITAGLTTFATTTAGHAATNMA
jgi:hypothetical protein